MTLVDFTSACGCGGLLWQAFNNVLTFFGLSIVWVDGQSTDWLQNLIEEKRFYKMSTIIFFFKFSRMSQNKPTKAVYILVDVLNNFHSIFIKKFFQRSVWGWDGKIDSRLLLLSPFWWLVRIPQMENFQFQLPDGFSWKIYAVKMLSTQEVSLIETEFPISKPNENFLLKFSLNFPLGTKSQIISAAVRTHVPMELCTPWLGAHGISLGEHGASRSSLHHVLSVSEKMINFHHTRAKTLE